MFHFQKLYKKIHSPSILLSSFVLIFLKLHLFTGYISLLYVAKIGVSAHRWISFANVF